MTNVFADRPWLASYPAGVPQDIEVPAVPVTALLDEATKAFPDTTAVAFLGNHLTWKELQHQVDRFAGGLAGIGVKQGDRVATVLPNCPQAVITFFAVQRLGAILVQHNPLYTPDELAHQLDDCGAEVAIVLDKVYLNVAVTKPRTQLKTVIVTSIIDYLPRSARFKLNLPLAKARKAKAELAAPLPSGSDVLQFTDLMKKSSGSVGQAPVAPDDVALLQYTTGTTGRSKGAMITHRNFVANSLQARAWDRDAQPGKEVAVGVLPLFHAYGLTLGLGVNTVTAGTLVLLPRFDIAMLVDVIDHYQPTVLPGVPPIYKALADYPGIENHNLRSLRHCISGAMKLTEEVESAFAARVGGSGRLIEGYGMTEASPVTHCNPIGGTARLGTVGLPLPSTECALVDANDPTRLVGIGEVGELVIRGPQVFAGYWNRPDETATTLKDLPALEVDGLSIGPWLITGDLGTMDADGFFTIVDRKKEIIVAGGFNIYPTEIEEVLAGAPGVAEISVVGVPDSYRGETVKAFVVPKPGVTLSVEELHAYAAERLTGYKIPKQWEWRDSLPKVGVGKVLRRVLRDEEAARVAGASASAADTSTVAVLAAPVEDGAAPARRAPARKAPARRAPAKKVPAAKAPVKRATTTKAPVKKAPAKTTAAKAPVKKAVAKKAPAAKTVAKTVAKAPVKKAPAKKVPAKTTAAKAPVKKTVATKTVAKKTTGRGRA